MKIDIYNSYCKVSNISKYDANTLSKALSYEDGSLRYLKVKNPKLYRFDTRKKLYNKKTKKFPTGLLSIVKDLFDDAEYIDHRKPPPETLFIPRRNKAPPLRYYQQEALDKTLELPRGTLAVATGGGKTRICEEIILSHNVPTLLITPNLSINDQTQRIFISSFGKKFVGDAAKPKDITVANYQALANKDQEFFDRFQMIICDECHHSSASTITGLNKDYFNHIYYRYFVSATPFRSDSAEDIALQAVIGEVVYEYSALQAIEDGYLTKPYFFIYEYEHDDNKYQSYHDEYEQEVVNNKDRNEFIKDIHDQIRTTENTQIIILVERIDHGQNLHDLIPDSTWINGETKNNFNVIADFNVGKISTLISTGVLGEGIDLPNAEMLIIAGSGKSKVQTIQKIGRVLRLADGKTKAIIVDFMDTDTKWLKKHSDQRIKHYKKI